MRQLRDWKGSVEVEGMDPRGMQHLRRAVRGDARAGPTRARATGSRSPPTWPAGVFDRAILAFSEAYAEQNQRDYQALEKAADTGLVLADRTI